MGQGGLGAEHFTDGLRVGVQVEEPPAPGDDRPQVPQVPQRDGGADVVLGRCERDDARAVRQPERATVATVADFLDPGHGGGG